MTSSKDKEQKAFHLSKSKAARRHSQELSWWFDCLIRSALSFHGDRYHGDSHALSDDVGYVAAGGELHRCYIVKIVQYASLILDSVDLGLV